MTINASRRAFLQRASALSLAGGAAPWAINLAAMGEAAAQSATGYKALVCVFLYGGNDYGNTLIPVDSASYNLYAGMRPTLAYSAASLVPTTLAPSIALPGGSQYALAPGLAPLLPHFGAGKLGVLLNVGTLIQPTTKAQYTAGSGAAAAQAVLAQRSAIGLAVVGARGRHLRLGRAHGRPVRGRQRQRHLHLRQRVGQRGVPVGPHRRAVPGLDRRSGRLQRHRRALFGSAACSSALQALVAAPRTHLFESEYTRVAARSISAGGVLTAALATAPTITTPFPSGNALADQLKFVARMISTAATTSTQRQVFFVSMGGFDTHDGLATAHPPLLTEVADALTAFYQSTIELGVANQVTTFTASDFGRTLTGDDGSDHGWGSMHFMLGGAVNGGRFYGTAPVVANGGPDDVGQGRLLPSTGVDQYAATLGKWFGISDTDLLTVLPNLGNWNASQRNLGFV